MFNAYLKFAWSSITNRKTRSLLTIIGILIGIAAVVALVSVGQGMQDAINEQLKTIGSNRLIITPGGGIMAGPATSGLVTAKLYEHDVDVVRDVRGVDYAIGVLTKSVRVEFHNEVKHTTCFAAHTDKKSVDFIQGIEYFVVDKGRYPEENEKYKAAIGSSLTEDFFDRPVNIGDKIFIEGQEFEVVVITKKSGNPMHDNKVAIPIDTARDMFAETVSEDEVMMIFAETKDGFEPSDVAADVKKAMRKDHNVKQGEEDFTVSTAEQMIESFSTILSVITLVLIGIAAISLLVGGVGIMSTMYTSVLEQTYDIGIMKAVGARNSDIMLIFLFESGILGLIGGVIGVVTGIGIGKIAEVMAAYAGVGILRISISPTMIMYVLLFSFLIGGISGLLPAREAARMKPVEALGYG